MTRYLIAALLGMIVVAAVGYLVYSRSLGAAPPPAAPPPSVAPSVAPAMPPPITPRAAVAVTVTGRVEKRDGAGWVELRAGDQLTAQDTIRTAEGARATLDLGAFVEVDDRTELTVGEISASLSEVALTEGRVSANAGATGGPTIRISTRDTDAIAETDVGRFDVLSSGTGQVTVAAVEGEVQVTARGATVIVPAGTLSTIRTGEAPTAPREIPTSLFLKVSAAIDARDPEAIRGRTTPGAVVSIGGVRATAAADGQFTGRAALRPGDNAIVVLVEDATGRRARRVLSRRVQATKPRLDTQVEWK